MTPKIDMPVQNLDDFDHQICIRPSGGIQLNFKRKLTSGKRVTKRIDSVEFHNFGYSMGSWKSSELCHVISQIAAICFNGNTIETTKPQNHLRVRMALSKGLHVFSGNKLFIHTQSKAQITSIHPPNREKSKWYMSRNSRTQFMASHYKIQLLFEFMDTFIVQGDKAKPNPKIPFEISKLELSRNIFVLRDGMSRSLRMKLSHASYKDVSGIDLAEWQNNLAFCKIDSGIDFVEWQNNPAFHKIETHSGHKDSYRVASTPNLESLIRIAKGVQP